MDSYQLLENMIVLYMLAIAMMLAFFLFRDWRSLRGIRSFETDSPDERDQRINVIGIRSNVLALLLISVVGAAQVGLEFSKRNSPERPRSAALSYEEARRVRLAEKRELKRYEEILDAIRNARLIDSSNQPDERWRQKLADLEGK